MEKNRKENAGHPDEQNLKAIGFLDEIPPQKDAYQPKHGMHAHRNSENAKVPIELSSLWLKQEHVRTSPMRFAVPRHKNSVSRKPCGQYVFKWASAGLSGEFGAKGRESLGCLGELAGIAAAVCGASFVAECM
jgi:hypothetical protein